MKETLSLAICLFFFVAVAVGCDQPATINVIEDADQATLDAYDEMVAIEATAADNYQGVE